MALDAEFGGGDHFIQDGQMVLGFQMNSKPLLSRLYFAQSSCKSGGGVLLIFLHQRDNNKRIG